MKTREMHSSYSELTGTQEGRRLLEQEALLVSATELIARLMEDKKVSRAEVARRVGKSKAFVTQVLRGPHNMTLRTLADLAWALGSRVRLQPARWISVQKPREMAPTKRVADTLLLAGGKKPKNLPQSTQNTRRDQGFSL